MSDKDKSVSDSELAPNPQQLERRGSKVRFSTSDLPSIDTENGDSSKKSRRSSLSPSETKSDAESEGIQLNHPRRRLSSKFESWDYNVVESQRFLAEQSQLDPGKIQKAAILRWFINFLIGAYVAVIAVVVALLITYLSKLKFWILYNLLEDCREITCLAPVTLVWIVWNCAFVLLGSYLVTFHAPHAAGSGIPQIKCYLNGIKLPGLLSLRTLIAKAGGVVLSVVGGLACGKEGPMIHSGAICASGMSQGQFGIGKRIWRPKALELLRGDDERRDFVAAGAASGVSAAFSAPVGGVLFALEEGASFLNQMLTWRMLFSSMTASLLLNIFMSAIKGHAENMSEPGLVSFGYIEDISYKTWELPIFMILALFGGLSGAAFVQINYKITLLRRKFVTRDWFKVGEAVVVAACSAIVLIVMIYAVPDCQPIRGYEEPSNLSDTTTTAKYIMSADHDHLLDRAPNSHGMHKRSAAAAEDDTDMGGHAEGGDGDDGGHGDGHDNLYGWHGHGYVVQGFCPYGEHNRMADILFKTPEGGLHAMLHQPLDEWSFSTLVILFIVYHLLASWTYGLMVSSGVFIPSLLTGALYGRCFGMVVMRFIPAAGTNIAKYALIGAACQLGGTVRMTISLTVIVIECTGDITFGIPIMLGLILAKWMGDFFNPGIYDLHIEIMGIPLLPWEPPAMCYQVRAREVMDAPVTVIGLRERMSKLVEMAEMPFHGFPVVEDFDTDKTEGDMYGTFGRLKGFILKSQIQKIVSGDDGHGVSKDEMDTMIDLRMYTDVAPFSISEDVSLPRLFRLFRGLGLRHLVVVNDRNRVSGIITRINLARYRSETVKGKLKVEELHVMDA